MTRVISVNMEGAPSGFEPIPAGSYEAAVMTVEEKIARSSGKPMLTWTFQVLEDGFEGRRAWLNTSLQPQAMFVLKRALLALGWTKEELSGALELDLDDLTGIQCTLVIVDDIDLQGQPRTKIDRLLPAGHSTGPTESAIVTGIGATPVVTEAPPAASVSLFG